MSDNHIVKQNQDTNMIQILKKRLESSMASELELQQREQTHSARVAQLERQLSDRTGDAGGQLQHEVRNHGKWQPLGINGGSIQFCTIYVIHQGCECLLAT